MNQFKVIAREGHHAVIDIKFEDEQTAKAVCAILGKITGVVLADQTVVLTPSVVEGALRTNGDTLYQVTKLAGGIAPEGLDGRRCRSQAASASPMDGETALP